jgi:multiple sugar transport system ATP-binding protein
MSRVIFDRVTKHFGEVVAVDDLSLEIHDKEFLVLLGPSGCGKSTALRIVAGLEQPTQGTVVIGDRVVNNVEAKNRDIAMVFQDYALYPHMSVYDNMAFSMRMRHVHRHERNQRVLEAAKTLGLETLLKRKPAELSGGQRQRVALGRAIVRQPSVFLMDEPLSNLDAKLRVQTRRELIKLHRRLQTTFIYVTHDQVEAMTMGERIAILKDGVLQQVDRPQDVYDRPASVFVASFIGSPAMNFFQAELDDQADRLVARSDGVEMQLSAAQAQALAKLPTRNVTIGVRPEHMVLGEASAKTDDHCVLAVVVDTVESLGAEQQVTFSNGESTIQARLDPSPALHDGEQVLLMFACEHLHFFDPETGLRIEDK